MLPSHRTGSEVTPLNPSNHLCTELARTSRRVGSLDPGRAPGRPPMSCCPLSYLGLTQLGRPINLILRHAAPQGANAGFVIASHSSGLSRTAATLVTIASAASATALTSLGRPIKMVLRHAAPQISRPTGSMLPPPSSDMLQSHRTGSEVTPLNPSNHLCCRTCSY